jgi:hypothetical protein
MSFEYVWSLTLYSLCISVHSMIFFQSSTRLQHHVSCSSSTCTRSGMTCNKDCKLRNLHVVPLSPQPCKGKQISPWNSKSCKSSLSTAFLFLHRLKFWHTLPRILIRRIPKEKMEQIHKFIPLRAARLWLLERHNSAVPRRRQRYKELLRTWCGDPEHVLNI